MSRRQQITMTPAEVDAYLQSQLRICIISNGRDGYPHPMPMNYCLGDDGTILMTTYRKSQKVLNFQRDARASLLVESGDDYADLRSVLIYARTDIIDERENTAAVMVGCRRHANRARGQTTTPEEDAAFAETALKRAEKRLVLRFHPERTISWDHQKLGGVY